MSTQSYPDHVFIPVQSGRATEDICLKLEAAILDGRLAPGRRLPSEREMQAQFGTGRGVVREAIKILQQKGLLEVRKGVKGGAYIRRLEVANVSESLALFLKQHPLEPETIIEFRESMDRTITLLAIARGTRDEKEQLLQNALRFEAMFAGVEPDLSAAAESDRKLNILLARMSGNSLFEWVMNAVQTGFSSYDFFLYQDPAYRLKVAANWSDTARAIAGGETMRALSCIGRHYGLLRQCMQKQNTSDRTLAIPQSGSERGNP